MSAAERREGIVNITGLLKELAEVLPLERDTTKTCYGVNNSHRDLIHRALRQIDDGSIIIHHVVNPRGPS